MAYSHDEMLPLKSRINSALEGGHLSNWQRQFLTDIEADRALRTRRAFQ